MSHVNNEKQQPEVITREVQVIPVQVQRVTTVQEQNAAQVSHDTLEKAIEVNRIAAQQELKRQIAAQQTKIAATREEHANGVTELEKQILNRELTRIRGLKEIKDLASLLGKIYGCKVSAASLVSKVSGAEFSPDLVKVVVNGRRAVGNSRSYRTSILDCFNEAGTRIRIDVTTTFKAQVLARAEDVEDADTDDIDEDHKGRKTISVNGWFQESELSTEERNKLRAVRAVVKRLIEEEEFLKNLESRLQKVGDQTDALKAQIYRAEIERSAGGKEILEMLDQNLRATVDGGYTALL